MAQSLPFVRSVYEPNLRLADLMIQTGRDAAEAERRRGDISAQLFSNLGQTIAGIPQQIQATKRAQLTDESTRLSVDAQKRSAADVSALDKAFQFPDRDTILNALPGHLRPTVQKQFTDADSSAAKLQKIHGELDQANNEYLAGLGASVADHDYDLHAAGLALQHARNTYERTNNADMLQRIDQIASDLQANPDTIKSVADSLITLSPERVKMRQTAQHNAALETQAKTTEEETARHNAAVEAIQRQTAGRQEAAATETARHDREMERLRAAQIAQGDAAPTLSQDALNLTAHQYAMTGQLPPMGMGKTGAAVRTAIINKAADVYKGLDLPTQIAAYKANQESLKKLQGQRDAIGAFEETALKNLDVFLNAASKIVDIGSPLLNQPLRAIAGKGLGSEEQTAFETARRTVVPEFAKILANPGLSGQLSDSARHEVEEVVKGNATMKQIIAAATVLKTDTANRRTAYDDQIKAIQQRIATPPGGQPAVKPDVVWELKDGKLVKVGG
jgi:hypothetical protein